MALKLREEKIGEETSERASTDAMDNLATIASATWICLIEAFGTGAAGVGDEVGAELLTQHELSQAQRVQQDANLACPSAFAGSTNGVTASNKLNKMANVAFN